MMAQNFSNYYEGGAVIDWTSDEDGEDIGYVERERRMLRYLESATSAPELEQVLHLQHILKKNAETEYLRKHKMNGATDLKSFRKRLPVTDYEAYRSFIERIVNGDTAPILSADPAVEVLVSSGTVTGDPKMYPVTDEDLTYRGLIWGFVAPTLNRVLPSLKEGKFLNLIFLRAGGKTPNGLPARTAVTSFIYSASYEKMRFHPIYDLSSPSEVLKTPNINSAMYAHLLCALLQRHAIRRIGALSCVVVVKALRALETWWAELCEDIAKGTVNKKLVQDETVRAAVASLLLEIGAETRAEMAKSIRQECVSDDGLFKQDGIIPRLWPNLEVIDTIGSGTMKSYLPSLAQYSNNMRIICTPLYSTTEGFFGLNMNPSHPPEETYYVLIPTVAYYEFIAICPYCSDSSTDEEFTSVDSHYSKVHPSHSKRAEDNGDGHDLPARKRSKICVDDSQEKILDLVSLKIGQQYQILVTTVSGYYRLSLGDILEVVGTYNKSPVFKFVRRMNTLLSVGHDKTDEEELQVAVSKATRILEKELCGLRVLEYTSYTSLQEPGHYVIAWELCSPSLLKVPAELPASLLDRCCSAMESTLNFIYREGRYEGKIGPLELNLVQPGTFDLLCEYAVCRGASISQYKVPRGLGPKQQALRDIVNKRVTQRHFSSTKPPFTPST